MTIEGTVINGVVVLDGSPQLPEGQRVIVDLESDDFGPPPSTETYAEHIASLRQAMADIDAGIKGMPLEQFAAEMKAEFGLSDTSDSMILNGTVINGVIVLDGSPQLAEGTRVFVDFENDDVAPPTETYAEHVATLKQSIAMMDAGERGRSVEDVFGEIERELEFHPR